MRPTSSSGQGAPDSASESDTGLETQTSESADGETPKFDLGSLPDLGPLDDMGCQNVDFLFVIDNSGSMADDQASLIASFPGFIEGIMSTVSSADSYHVGVITTDQGSNPSPCGMPGALITRTEGLLSSEMACGPYAAGTTFMTEQDDLPAAFACAAKVGIDGDGEERHFRSLGAAVSDELNAPGACNAGFLRDDALLVITIISDENDESGGTIEQWYERVVEAKLGIESNIVVLNLVGLPGSFCPSASPDVPATTPEIGSRQIEFTGMFTYGFEGDVCTPSYDQFFTDALEVIQDACRGFTPPG